MAQLENPTSTIDSSTIAGDLGIEGALNLDDVLTLLDNKSILLGDDGDASVQFDGTNLVIDPDTDATVANKLNLLLSGAGIGDIGGTTSASSGDIALANAVDVFARNSGDTNDFGFRFSSNDDLRTVFSGTERHRMDSNGDLDIEGTLNESASL